ncbi:hypothetical protein ACROYT_G031881 [Oculina patagonica]
MSDEEGAVDEENIDGLSHPEVMSLFSEKLAEIMSDPLLIGLPNEPTLDEVNSQIALEHGRAIVVNVRQHDEMSTVLPVVVIQNATVHDLKKAIQRHISLKLSREGGPNIISWKHVWKTYWLSFQGQKLTEDHQPLTYYGIQSKDEVTFVKRLRRK